MRDEEKMMDWMGRHWQIPVSFFLAVAVMFCALVFGMVKGCEYDSQYRIERAKASAEQSKAFWDKSNR